MSQELTYQDNDGFSGSLNSGRVGRGSYLKWNDSEGWQDRDGLTPPSPVLVVGIDEIVRRWKDKQPENIVDKPLPNVETLNGAIPITEWERGIDGKARPPWAHTIVVYLVNPMTGETYTYSAATTGAHIAWNQLREAVVTMRMLRGTRVIPVINLAERPMKTKFGMKMRPHFEIVGWKTPGEDTSATQTTPTPQISGPTVAPPPTSTPAGSATTSPAQPRKPKQPVNLSDYTLAAMGDVKPATSEELFNDTLDALPEE
jgi:hypothetical protein